MIWSTLADQNKKLLDITLTFGGKINKKSYHVFLIEWYVYHMWCVSTRLNNISTLIKTTIQPLLPNWHEWEFDFRYQSLILESLTGYHKYFEFVPLELQYNINYNFILQKEQTSQIFWLFQLWFQNQVLNVKVIGRCLTWLGKKSKLTMVTSSMRFMYRFKMIVT